MSNSLYYRVKQDHLDDCNIWSCDTSEIPVFKSIYDVRSFKCPTCTFEYNDTVSYSHIVADDFPKRDSQLTRLDERIWVSIKLGISTLSEPTDTLHIKPLNIVRNLNSRVYSILASKLASGGVDVVKSALKSYEYFFNTSCNNCGQTIPLPGNIINIDESNLIIYIYIIRWWIHISIILGGNIRMKFV